VPVVHAERQSAAIPGAVLHVVPGEGHVMFVDHLEEILRELLAPKDMSPRKLTSATRRYRLGYRQRPRDVAVA
jgi:hypothetical protein